jgi:tRNA(Ile2) C34 agmatinyltransferase TiaS
VIKAESVPCADPLCRGRAEPEQDGDHTYFECEDCGYAFGFTRTDVLAKRDNGCAVGVPEDVRRAASQPMTNALRASAPPLLSIGRRPDAAIHDQERHDHA